jgi:hypothetical protein
MHMKMSKKYAVIPQERVADFMRLFPAARLHAWPNTWSFPKGFKAAVDEFLANTLSGAPVDHAPAMIVDEEPPPAAPTDKALAVALSRVQIHALERLLRRITEGTVEALAADEAEKAAMRSALIVLKRVLRKELMLGEDFTMR